MLKGTVPENSTIPPAVDAWEWAGRTRVGKRRPTSSHHFDGARHVGLPIIDVGLNASRILRTLSLGWLVALCPLPIGAATWVEGDSGGWEEANRWVSGLPEVGTDVVILGGSRVGIGSDVPDSMLRIGRLDLGPSSSGSPMLWLQQLGGRGIHAADTVTMDGSSTIRLESASLRIDGGVGGHLNFRSGTIQVQTGTLQTMGGATLRVGRTGHGVLSVDNGFVEAGNDLIVGGLAGALGILELRSGVIQVHGLLQVADDVGSVGEIDVQGGTLTAVQTTSRIGDDGRGSLRMGGGFVRLADVSVGRDMTGRGSIVMTGGRLEAEDVSLGRLPGSQGIATLSGGELHLPNDTLYVGREGHGELVVSGATVVVSNLVVSASATATGRMEIQSGIVRAQRLLMASEGATVRWAGGRLETGFTDAGSLPFVVGDGRSVATLVLLGGEHHFPGGLVISANASLEGAGSISGPVTILPGGINRLQGIVESPQAPRLAPVVRDGRLLILVSTESGVSYRLEMRMGMEAPWVGVGRVDGTGTPWEYEVPVSQGSYAIYRAVVP